MSVSQVNKYASYECCICYYRTDSLERLDKHIMTHFLHSPARGA